MYVKLKQERERQGKTQKQIAEAANVTVRGYQNYEQGLQIPSVEIAKKIASALNCTVEFLFS